jgi:hypothetical protein
VEDQNLTENVSQEETAEIAEPQPEQPSAEEAAWEQRYKSLEGIYRKQKAEMDALKVSSSGADELKEVLTQTHALIAQQGDDIAALMEHLATQPQVSRKETSIFGEEEAEKPKPSPLNQRIGERRERSEQAKLFADMVRDAGYSPTDSRFRECWQEPNPIRAVTKKIAEIAKAESQRAKEEATATAQEMARDELKKYINRNPQAVKVGRSTPSGGGYGFADIEQAYAEGRISRTAYKEAREKYGI